MTTASIIGSFPLGPQGDGRGWRDSGGARSGRATDRERAGPNRGRKEGIMVAFLDQVIRENPASRGTETSAEVLVGPPLGAGGWSETPVNSSGTRLTLTLDGGLEGPPRPVMAPFLLTYLLGGPRPPAASSHATASAGCRTSACRGPSSSGACSAASSSEDRRRECRSTCRTPTSRPVPGRRGTAGRPRVSAHGRRACRKAGAERGPRRDGATRLDRRLIESRIVLELHAASVPHTDL